MKPKVFNNLNSFEVWPKKTFLGLDKSKAHCFTLPKPVADKLINKFRLRPGFLQQSIVFVIDGIDYKAIARMVVMDRSKPNKLQKDELPSRTVVQFQWSAFNETCEEIAFKLTDAIECIANGKNNDLQSVIFAHIRLNRFCLEFTNQNDPDYTISISEI